MHWRIRLDPRNIETLDEAQAEALKGATITDWFAMIFDANRTLRTRITEQLLSDHPDWCDQQIAAEVARRMLTGTS